MESRLGGRTLVRCARPNTKRTSLFLFRRGQIAVDQAAIALQVIRTALMIQIERKMLKRGEIRTTILAIAYIMTLPLLIEGIYHMNYEKLRSKEIVGKNIIKVPKIFNKCMKVSYL